jgi:hypothetical protein
MLSKPILRKSTDLEVRVTDNPRWQAPIPLYETGIEMVMLKLRRNPTKALSPTYKSSTCRGLDIR